MVTPRIRVLPALRNTVVVIDDQSTGLAILEQVVRGIDAFPCACSRATSMSLS